MTKDYAQYLETFEKAREKLELIETKLAIKLKLSTHCIRAQLCLMDQRNELVEDALVADWHQAYASYADWVEEEAKNE